VKPDDAGPDVEEEPEDEAAPDPIDEPGDDEPDQPAKQLATTSPPPDPAKVHQVLTWMLAGESDFDVVAACQAHWPDDAPKPIIAAVISQLIKSADIHPEIITGWCFEATRFLYQKLVDIGDFAGALRAVKQLEELSRKHG
jgi:hypothetical protein